MTADETRGIQVVSHDLEFTDLRLTHRRYIETNTAGLAAHVLGLLPAVAKGRRAVSLDFGGVEFVSSTMLEEVLALHRRVQDGGGRLTLRNLNTS